MESNYKDIHIGSLVQTLVKERGISESRINNFFKLDTDEIERMYEEKSIDTEMLLKWCKLLEYDFFRIYSQHLLLYAPPLNANLKNNKVETVPTFIKSLYTPEIIEFIVEQLENKVKTPTEIIEQYRIPKTTLYRWIKKHNKA